ncbi:protein kinase domain-containing protein [Embleya sp. NPDC001921]
MQEIGRYVLGPLLGRGGMALVRQAQDTRLGRAVAVKLLAPELAHDPVVRRRFLTEARAAAGLNHPGIVIVHDHDEFEHEGEMVAYLVMELIRGRTLAQLLAERGSLPVQEALPIGRAILAALDHAHRHLVVHRDVKPANVMVREDGGLKVTDFGIARITGSDSSRLTAAGAVLGTVAYMPPEVVQGGEAGPEGDVYAVGCLLYELLTGQVPYRAPHATAVMYHHVHSAVPSVSDEVPGLPREIDALVAKAMAKETTDRYPNAGEMLAALMAVPSAPPDVDGSAPIVRTGAGDDEHPPLPTRAGDGPGQAWANGEAEPNDEPRRPPEPGVPDDTATSAGSKGPETSGEAEEAEEAADPGAQGASKAQGAPAAPEAPDDVSPGADRTFPPTARESAKTARVVAVLLVAALVVGVVLTFGPGLLDHGKAKDDTPETSSAPRAAGDGATTPSASAPRTVPPATPTGVPRSLLARGYLNVGVPSESPDLAVRDEVTGTYSGFDIEIAKIVATHLGFGPERVRFLPVAPADRVQAIVTGRVDYYVGTFTITDDRRKYVAFAGPYLVSGQGVLVRTDDRVLTGFDSSLAHRRVCSVTGSTSLTKLRHDVPQADATARESYGKCVADLLNGQVDAVTSDQVLLQGYVASHPGQLRLVGSAVTAEKYGIGLSLENSPLRAVIDDALRSAFAGGAWKGAYERTLGRTGIPAPPIPVLERN